MPFISGANLPTFWRVPMLRDALAAMSIIVLAFIAWPVYAVLALGSRRGIREYYG
jgi:hypothetical protein